MKDNAREELETILDMAREWCVENGRDYLSVGVVGNFGSADIGTDDRGFYGIIISKFY